jgi:phytol kinase
MMHPAAGMALVLGVLGGLLGALTLLRRLASPHPEWLRKLLHVGMGLTTLAFPWLFDRTWPVVTLAALSVGLLLAMRLVSSLKAGVGQVVGGVRRFSLGEIYFPLVVALLWVLYVHGDETRPERRLLLYVIPLLLLTLSDASAALVGVYYGRWRYATPEGFKSHEGSAAFFLCSFLCVHVPLLLLSDRGRAETLLTAVLLAWLATMFEAVAWGGLDNLILPLVSHLLLILYWDLSVGELLMRLAVTGGVSCFVLACSWRTTLQGSALLGAILVGYICWALGGWSWLLPPLLVFASYTLHSPRAPGESQKVHNIHAILSVSSVGLLWLFLSRLQDRPGWYYPFTVSFAAHLAIIGLARRWCASPKRPTTLLLIVCIGEGWLLLMAAYVLLEGGSTQSFVEALVALPATAAAACGFCLLQPGMDDCPVDTARWLRQAACSGAASVLALGLAHLAR